MNSFDRMFSIGVAATALVTVVAFNDYNHRNDNSTKDKKIQNKIETTTNVSTKNVKKSTITWPQALNSLKTKSAVEKAYFQGGQAVRDSIANAAKIAKDLK